MAKQLPQSLQTHLDGGTTTLAWCWRLTRNDGAVFGFIDSWIVSSLATGQRIEGQRLENLTLTTSTEGAVIPRIYGRMRLGGNIISAADFTETVNTTPQGGGNNKS